MFVFSLAVPVISMHPLSLEYFIALEIIFESAIVKVSPSTHTVHGAIFILRSRFLF